MRHYTTEEVARAVQAAALYTLDGLRIPDWVQARLDYGDDHLDTVQQMAVERFVKAETDAAVPA